MLRINGKKVSWILEDNLLLSVFNEVVLYLVKLRERFYLFLLSIDAKRLLVL